MATPVADRQPSARSGSKTPSKNARMSAARRKKRPIPATRDEADELFGPSPAYRQKLATAPRLIRLQALGLIPQFTNEEAHQLILDALYPPDQAA